MNKTTSLVFICLLLATFAIGQSVAPRKIKSPVPDFAAIYKGKAYQPFDLTTLDGKVVSSATSSGKVTFMSFWFESCPGCRAEFKEVNELYARLKNDPKCQFVAITYDSATSLPAFIKQYDLRFPIATTENRDIQHKLNYGMACPGIIILDKGGKIAHIGNNALTKNEEPGGYNISIDKAVSIIKSLE